MSRPGSPRTSPPWQVYRKLSTLICFHIQEDLIFSKLGCSLDPISYLSMLWYVPWNDTSAQVQNHGSWNDSLSRLLLTRSILRPCYNAPSIKLTAFDLSADHKPNSSLFVFALDVLHLFQSPDSKLCKMQDIATSPWKVELRYHEPKQ